MRSKLLRRTALVLAIYIIATVLIGHAAAIVSAGTIHEEKATVKTIGSELQGPNNVELKELSLLTNEDYKSIYKPLKRKTSTTKTVNSDIKNVASRSKPVKETKEVKRAPLYDANSRRNFKLTAYDLTIQSCGKAPSHPAFGITASGYSLKHKDLRDRKIAVDPNLIPLGSKVYIEFPESLKTVVLSDGTVFKLDGIYTAVDTGSAVYGNKVDLFVGGADRFSHTLALNIGVRQVKVYNVN